MEGQQNVQLPPGTTAWNHSYFSGNSFSAPHSAQQLQNGTIATSVQPLASIQEANGAASSGFVSSPLLPRSAINSQVTAGPTRNGTGDVMPLAEAITQLSSFIRTFYQNLASTVKNYHGIIEQLHFISQAQAELQNELYVEQRRDISRIIAIWIG